MKHLLPRGCNCHCVRKTGIKKKKKKKHVKKFIEFIPYILISSHIFYLLFCLYVLANCYIQHVQKYTETFLWKKKMFLVFEPMQEKKFKCLISDWIQNTIKFIYLQFTALSGLFQLFWVDPVCKVDENWSTRGKSPKSLVWVAHNSKKWWNMANSVDPDQTLRSAASDLTLGSAASDLGLHGLQRAIYPNT